MVASKTATRCLRLVFRKMAHAGLRHGLRRTPPISSERHGRIEDGYTLFTACFSQNGARWPAPWPTLDSTNFLPTAWSHRRLLHVVYGLFFAKWRTLACAVANAGLHQFPPKGMVASKTATCCLRIVFRKMAHAGQRRGQRWTPPISSERQGRIEDGYTLFTACFSQNGARWPAPWPTLDSTNFLRKAWSHRRRLHVVYGLFFAKWRTLACAAANAGLHQFPPKGMVASKTATRCLRLVFRKMAHAGQRRGQRWTPPISSERHGRIEDGYTLFTACFSQNGARWPAPWPTLDSTNFLRLLGNCVSSPTQVTKKRPPNGWSNNYSRSRLAFQSSTSCGFLPGDSITKPASLPVCAPSIRAVLSFRVLL
jgi:hypothetical protein